MIFHATLTTRPESQPMHGPFHTHGPFHNQHRRVSHHNETLNIKVSWFHRLGSNALGPLLSPTPVAARMSTEQAFFFFTMEEEMFYKSRAASADQINQYFSFSKELIGLPTPHLS